MQMPLSATLLALHVLIIVGNSQNAVAKCPSQYFFDVQHCQLCQPYCTCSSYLGCDSCIDGYTKYKQTCIQCPSANGIYGKCTSCCSHTNNTQLTCTNCQLVNNYYSYIMAGRCVLSEGCQAVDTNGYCTSCMQGYYSYDNLCRLCDASCSSCVDSDNCVQCNAGFYWALADYGLCKPCPIGCTTCTTTSINVNNNNILVCTQCKDGYYLYTNHCLPCAANCLTCIDGSTCTSCSSGLLISSLCIECNHSSYGGSLGCLACRNNRYFIQCTLCDDGYFLDTYAGVCRACDLYIIGAAMCNNSKVATQCKNDYSTVLTSRYYLLGTTCVLNTKSCRQMADMLANCSTCYDNYVLAKGACVPCPFAGCNAVSTASNVCVCYNCTPGYYLSGVQCLPCIVSHCSTCPTATTCSVCKQGYYLSNPTTCLNATAANCLQSKTSSASLCSVCVSGYYLGTDLLCYSCQTNCLSCTARTNCIQCISNTILSNGYCISYPNNCVEATLYNNNIVCTLCSYGYYLYTGICSPCTIQLGTLSNCNGLCPADQNIQAIMVQLIVYYPHLLYYLHFLLFISSLSLF